MIVENWEIQPYFNFKLDPLVHLLQLFLCNGIWLLYSSTQKLLQTLFNIRFAINKSHFVHIVDRISRIISAAFFFFSIVLAEKQYFVLAEKQCFVILLAVMVYAVLY